MKKASSFMPELENYKIDNTELITLFKHMIKSQEDPILNKLNAKNINHNSCGGYYYNDLILPDYLKNSPENEDSSIEVDKGNEEFCNIKRLGLEELYLFNKLKNNKNEESNFLSYIKLNNSNSIDESFRIQNKQLIKEIHDLSESYCSLNTFNIDTNIHYMNKINALSNEIVEKKIKSNKK